MKNLNPKTYAIAVNDNRSWYIGNVKMTGDYTLVRQSENAKSWKTKEGVEKALNRIKELVPTGGKLLRVVSI